MEPRRRFKFLKELAQGGFGKVYLAEMITGDNFSSVVAIKLLHGKWLSNDEIVMRSRDEARLLGRLRHRNIVRVEDLTSIGGQCAIVMEYLQGLDLKSVAVALKEQERRFPRKAAIEAIGAIAAALDAAYTHRPLQGGEALQVIHRDIKPSNAMITVEGDVKVLDFGTARATFEEREAKTQVLAFGSQAYMAPERMLGEADAPSGDIFSLGITLYECITLDSFGKIPLRQERYEPTMAARLDALDLADMTPAGRDAVLSSLRRMLAYEPEARPSAAQVIDEMEALADLATDAGLKRFSRELVRKVCDAWNPDQDPNDPYTGAMMYEDVTGVGEARTADPVGTPSGGQDEFRVPPELADLPVDHSHGSLAAASGASAASAAYASPPTPPRVASFLPAAPAAALDPGACPGPDATWPPPSAADTGQRSGPRGKPSSTSDPVTHSAPTLATLSSSGTAEDAGRPAGLWKVGVALGAVALLGLLAAVALGLVAIGTSSSTPPVLADVATAKMPGGKSDVDWAPNAKGKGGAILRVPDGASEVVITTSSGFRQEWDGSMNLRLKDLEPGSARAKLKLSSGTRLTDFPVTADQTCLLTWRSGAWERGECR
ncbi:MAG: serine/threonine protein kinase [Myxococcales bacterium]|nr:serine/threonine protein kinase [Myxococcales bacterium]